jgi:hypothetical protein
MGMKAASLALLCKDAENREALEETGFTCPRSKEEQAADVKRAQEELKKKQDLQNEQLNHATKLQVWPSGSNF